MHCALQALVRGSYATPPFTPGHRFALQPRELPPAKKKNAAALPRGTDIYTV